MEKWFVTAKRADFEKWGREFHISPIVARVLRNRDLTEEDDVRKFLYGTLKDCYSPWLLKDMDRAVERLVEALDQNQTIRVIGDYDVDGICAAYILTRGLECLGANVDTAIPHRIHDGYGLNDHLIELAAEDGIELIITCDNGIAAAPQIELAASLGIDVIVTDHHEVPYETVGEERETGNDLKTEDSISRREVLPPALAVVDPKRADCGYPYKGICGAVVAYKLMQALLETLQGDGREIFSGSGGARTQRQSDGSAKTLADAMDEMLEFAAFATVCDVMELRDENRIIVKEGLKRMKNSRNMGLRALIEVNGLDPAKLSAYHLGFVLGPCINATGRLDTAQKALELLQSGGRTEAMNAARELTDLNISRKNMTLEGVEEAVRRIEEEGLDSYRVLVIFLPGVHESLAGIIAGRVRERYNKPVFILTRGEDGVKGSGRSIEGYHMFEAMTEVKELFTKYGGHKMAAGLSMREGDIETLRRALNENCRLTEEDLMPKVHIDVPMPLACASEELAEQLELLEPFGVGNPRPLFAQKDLIFTAGFKMGANQSSARFRVRTPEGTTEQLVLFRDLDVFDTFLDEKYGAGSAERLYEGRGDFAVSVVYQLGLNTYKGMTEKQMLIQHYC